MNPDGQLQTDQSGNVVQYQTAPAGATTPSPIAADQIQTQTPINLAGTQPTPDLTSANATVAGAGVQAKNTQSYINDLTAPKTDTQIQADTLTSRISDLLGQDTGKTQALYNAETANNIPGLTSQLNDINNQILTHSAAYDQMNSSLEANASRNGVTTFTLGGQQGAVLRQKASDIGMLTARAQALQGNISLAKATAAQAVDLKYAPIEEELQAKQAQLALLQPTLNKEEAIQAKALDRQYAEQQTQIANEKEQSKNNLGIALQAGVTTPYVNNNGKFFNAANGTTYATPQDFFKAAGVTSFADAYQRGLVTDVNNATLQNSNFAAQAAAKYPDANIKVTDTPDQVAAKLKNSAIYRKDTYIAPPAGGNVSGSYIPGVDPVTDAYVSAIQNGNATMQQVPAQYRNAVAVALSQGTQSAAIIDPKTDAQVKAIIAANPGEYGKAADAINALQPGLADKYDAQLRAVYNDKKQVGEAFNQNTIYSPLAASRFSTAANRIVKNFVDLPQYQLTANGLPYLQRIQAAIQTPGSVSDQDLLDSLTKLNTAGNAISDAQVKLITDGKSYSDWANTLANKFKNGGVLSDNQRQQIVTIANNIYANYKKGYQPVYNQATQQLKDAGVPEAFWTIPDLNTLSDQAQQNSDNGGGINWTDSSGKVWQFPDQGTLDKFKKDSGIQ